MILFALRAAEIFLLSALPSFVSAFLAKNIFSAVPDMVISIILFLIFMLGIAYLGFKFMSITGNVKKYAVLNGGAYLVFILLSILAAIAGDEIFSCLFGGFGILIPIGQNTAVSLISGHAVVVLLLTALATVERKEYAIYNYKFLLNFYKKYIIRKKKIITESGEVSGIIDEDAFTEEEYEERQRRRSEYESRYTNIRPAKYLKSDSEERAVPNRDREEEKRIRVQQYCADELSARTHKAVDREAELQKARALQRQLEDEEERRYSEEFVLQRRKEKNVDREVELQKAKALQKQLEYEEEEKIRRMLRKK